MSRFDIDDIHDDLRAGRDITASQALVYAQHHIAIAIADEREACATIAARVRQRPGQGIIACEVARDIEAAIRNRSK